MNRRTQTSMKTISTSSPCCAQLFGAFFILHFTNIRNLSWNVAMCHKASTMGDNGGLHTKMNCQKLSLSTSPACNEKKFRSFGFGSESRASVTIDDFLCDVSNLTVACARSEKSNSTRELLFSTTHTSRNYRFILALVLFVASLLLLHRCTWMR